MQDEDHIGNNIKKLENLAREKHDSSICYKIAEKFIKGDGVVKDLALASMWFDLEIIIIIMKMKKKKNIVWEIEKRGKFFNILGVYFTVVAKAKELLSQYLYK